jgi:hypothetical protein
MLANLNADPELFHTVDGTAFADLMIDGHRETWPVRGTRFRSWLRRRHYEATGEAPCAGAIRSALDLFEAHAQFDGPQRAVHVRTAAHEGRLYLDIADDLWRAVEIGPDEWRVTWCPPVRFRGAAGMLPLAMPTKGGLIEALAPFLNLSRRNDFVLVVAWLLAAWRSLSAVGFVRRTGVVVPPESRLSVGCCRADRRKAGPRNYGDCAPSD